MIHAVEKLESEALNLPKHLRARPAELLLSSLDEDTEIEQAWIEEAERRSEELRTGKVAGIPSDQVFARAYHRYT